MTTTLQHQNYSAGYVQLCVHGMSTQEWIALFISPCCICSTSLTGWTKPSVIYQVAALAAAAAAVTYWMAVKCSWTTHCAGWICTFVSSYICLFVPLFACLINTWTPLDSNTCSPDEGSKWGRHGSQHANNGYFRPDNCKLHKHAMVNSCASPACTDSVCKCCLASSSRHCIVMPPHVHMRTVVIVVEAFFYYRCTWRFKSSWGRLASINPNESLPIVMMLICRLHDQEEGCVPDPIATMPFVSNQSWWWQWSVMMTVHPATESWLQPLSAASQWKPDLDMQC